MGVGCLAIYKYVVKVNQYVLVEDIAKYMIHEALESTGGVTQPKW